MCYTKLPFFSTESIASGKVTSDSISDEDVGELILTMIKSCHLKNYFLMSKKQTIT